MKRKIVVWLLVLAALLVLYPLRKHRLHLVHSADYDEFNAIDQVSYEAQIRDVAQRLKEFEASGKYPLPAALAIERQLNRLGWHTKTKEKDAYSIQGSGGEYYPEHYIPLERLKSQAWRLAEALYSQEEIERFQQLRLEHLKQDFQLKAYVSREELTGEFGLRLTAAVLLLLLAVAVLTVPKALAGGVRKLFTRKSLNFFGDTVAFIVSVFTGCPAVAQKLIEKNKKEQQQIVLVENNKTPQPLAAPPKWEIKLEGFTDINRHHGHDRQYLVSVFRRLNPRWSLAFISQFRQDLINSGALEVPTFGVRYRPTKSLAFTAVTGPEWNNTKATGDRFRLKNVTTFLVLNYKPPTGSWKPTILSLHRLPRETDASYSDTHRHITAIRAGPMPEWLSVQNEYKRSRGRTMENFWGTPVNFGRWFKGRVKTWLGGWYAYPYYDFQTSWNVRFGWAKSFAIP